jgi:hypothetical protein
LLVRAAESLVERRHTIRAGAKGGASLASRLVPAVAIVSTLLATGSEALPPIRYQGELRSNNRALVQESEAQSQTTLQTARTLRLGLDTFIWQPWFATAGTAFELGHQMTFGREDSQGLLLAGHGRVDVFPASRFPFAAFVDVSDSQLDFESSLVEARDSRRYLFGVSQRYQRLDGRGQANARLTRSLQEAFDGRKTTIDRGALQGRLRFERQTLDGDVNVKRETSNRIDGSLLEAIGNGQHLWRPNDELSIESFATVTDRESERDGLSRGLLQSLLSSFAAWRPTGKPYTVDGGARWSLTRASTDARTATTNSFNGNVRGTYDVNPALRVSGDVTGEHFRGEEQTASRVSQSLSASYTPPARPLRGFSYSWFAGANVGNSWSDVEGSQHQAGINLGHSASRSMPVFGSTTTSASLSASQSGSVQGDTRAAGGLFSLVHQLSGGFARATVRGSSQLRLTVTDNRSLGAGGSFAADETVFQSAGLVASHNGNIDSFSSWGANASMGLTSQSFDGEPSSTTSFTQANLSYRHSRLFGVPRLRFRTQLNAGTNNLVLLEGLGGEEDRYDVRWEAEANYSIGLLNARLRGNIDEVNGRRNYSVLLTLSRAFGGVF